MIFFSDKELSPWFHQSKSPKREGWYLVDDVPPHNRGERIYLPSTRGPQEVALPPGCAWRYWHPVKRWMRCDEDGNWREGQSVLSPWRGMVESFDFKIA